MLFLAPTFDNAEPLFALVINNRFPSGLHNYYIDVADQDPAIGSIHALHLTILSHLGRG